MSSRRLRQLGAASEEDQRTFTALTLSVVNAGCLMWWTTMQYRWIMIFGFPLISDGGLQEPGRALGYYHHMPGTSWNVPEFYFTVTLLANVLLLPAAWQFTKGARGRWRMLLLIGISAVLSLGFSYTVVRWEETHLKRAEWARVYYVSKLEEADWKDEHYSFKLRRLDEAVEEYREATNR